jgi:hypothetical protein
MAINLSVMAGILPANGVGGKAFSTRIAAENSELSCYDAARCLDSRSSVCDQSSYLA